SRTADLSFFTPVSSDGARQLDERPIGRIAPAERVPASERGLPLARRVITGTLQREPQLLGARGRGAGAIEACRGPVDLGQRGGAGGGASGAARPRAGCSPARRRWAAAAAVARSVGGARRRRRGREGRPSLAAVPSGGRESPRRSEKRRSRAGRAVPRDAPRC